MEEVATLPRIAPRITDTKTEHEPPIRVTLHPATVRALARPPLRYDWPDGTTLPY